MKIHKIILLILYSFYIIYLPDFAVYLPFLPNPSVIISIIALINILLLNRRLLWFIKNLETQYLIIIIFLSLIHLFLLNLTSDFNLVNLWPFVQFFVQIVNFMSILIWYKKVEDFTSVKSFVNFLLFIALIQFVIIILMQLIPPFKEIAVTLYGGEEGVSTGVLYLLSYRIYGIASGYTFMLPLVQGIFAVLSLHFFYLEKEMKYLLTSVALIYSSILNGRTGLYLYLIIFFYYFLKIIFQKISFKILLLIIIVGSMSVLFGIILVNTNSQWLVWVSDGINQVNRVFFQGEINSNDTLGVLINEHLLFPKGIDFIWGIGRNIFNDIDYYGAIIRSDIGYINDFFRGGLLFITVFYSSVLVTLYKLLRNSKLFFVLLFYILLANFKGEVMIGTPLIMVCLLIGFAFKYESITYSK